ncbi:MAG: aldehyde ferredoxin oxidoreductase [Proteobacteria bacterium]|nr:aldehyde ferredoxin oxidoreductase [Pseudomonadota bacterium]NIS72557.1 aldehyde ferredoxin oxidoreductase [Pseudomonadota bacterium]
MFQGGYLGKILRVDLSRRSVSDMDYAEELRRKYLGGRGIAAYLYHQEMPSIVDPLGSANKIFFVTGPLTGAPVLASTKMQLTTRSPDTGYYLCSNSSGNFGPYLKFAGYDGVILEGKASSPVSIIINENGVEFRNASHLWGRKTPEVDDYFKEALNGRKIGVLSVGPAAERGVRVACIQVDGRSFGRGGAGAVMAGKNVKALVSCGTKKLDIANPVALKEYVSQARAKVRQFKSTHTTHGTAQYTEVINELGCYPTRNFQTAIFDGIDTISSTYMKENYFVRNKACYRCPVGCAQVCAVQDGPFKGAESDPEYETIGAFGGQCGVSDFGAIIAANQICDEEGIDTMTTGTLIAFAMECFERGLISREETDGLDLRFGNAEAMVEMVRRIANRKGLGNLLADGFLHIKKKRPELEYYMMHVKGLAFAQYEPRGFHGIGLGYGTSSRGACHNVGGWTIRDELIAKTHDRFATRGKGRLVKTLQDNRAYVDSLGICTVVRGALGFTENPTGNALAYVTGYDFNPELMMIGSRIYTLERMILNREGIGKKDDILPRRIMEEPLAEGMAKGRVVTAKMYDEMLDEYYMARGWDDNGVPKKETLAALAVP